LRASDLILVIDIGTSAAKAVLFDSDAKQVAITRQPYPIHTPQAGWSEQEPDVVYNGVLAALREITASRPARSHIAGISFSSQLYSILAVDAKGQALSNSLTWSDTRSAAVARALNQSPEAREVNRRSGCPLEAIYPLAKIRWLQENMDLPEQVKFVSIKEYVIARLLDRWVVDWSVASASGMFDIRRHQWDPAALSLLGLNPANLSELVSPKQIFMAWPKEIIDLIGLPADTPFIMGGGDGPLASIGVGAFSSETLAVNVGTSAAARLIVPEARVDPAGRLWTYVVDENLWVMGGIVSSGGIVYDWSLRNFFSGLETTDTMSGRVHEYAEGLASMVPPGAEDLCFIPYLGGEQCPDWHPHTRGGFFGLDFRHQQGHLVRAVLEGITRSLCRVADSMRATLGVQFQEIRVTGGLSSSALWLQIAADMFGVPIVVPASVEGSARGAAILALIALGQRSSPEEFADPVLNQARVYPREEIHIYYQKQNRKFQKLLDFTRSL
jgi:gluconokinase